MQNRVPVSAFIRVGCSVPKDIEIAVIDDDPSFRVALVESLASLGYRCGGYSSAEDYLSSVGEKVFDCIVTDIHMQGMSGFDLAQRLGVLGLVTPVILITARSEAYLAARASTVGAVCLLRKPFRTSDLVNCIETAVRGSTN
ncbi:MAG: response regulator [Mesorhizobium sp.]|nr:response regulator [Mesorhizobium sp. M7A.F.Ce.TU.012.03.2.1]TIM23707.1 MAG: response regulator [Mesorhizobium sp.]TIN71029.1 MAG: response regulator [Mesorhizobium sp.]TIU42598.1 MAG: response regulator [Mesorhizobium sp.]